MHAKPLPSTVLQALLLILFNLTLISAKGGGAGGGGGGGGGGAGTGGGRSGNAIGGGLGGGGLARNTGAIIGLVIGIIALLILVIVIAVWHKSMMAAYKRMDSAKLEPGKQVKAKAASKEADLEAAKPIFREVPAPATSGYEDQRPYAQVAAEEDAADAGKKKKNYSMWKWMLF